MKTSGLTFNDIAGLLSGRISYIMVGSAKLYHDRKNKLFIMDGKKGRHTLHVDATDDDRLRAHWKGFVETAA